MPDENLLSILVLYQIMFGNFESVNINNCLVKTKILVYMKIGRYMHVKHEMDLKAHPHILFGVGKYLNLSRFLVCFFICYSCHNSDRVKNSEYPHSVTTVSIDLERTGEYGIGQFIDTILYVPLETTDHCYVGSVDKVILDKDRIFILDKTITSSVFCFDMQGRFLFVIANRGRGPEEYLEITDFDVALSEGVVLIHDGDRGAILVYNSDNGSFKGRYPISFRFDGFFYASGNILVAYSNHTRFNPQIAGNKNIMSFDYRKDTFLSGSLEFDPELGFSEIVPEAFSYISRGPGRAAIYDLFTSSIYLYSGLEWESTISIDFRKKSIPEDYWKQADALSFRKSINEGTFTSGFLNFQVFGEWLVGLFNYKGRYHCVIYNTESHEYSVSRNMIMFSKLHLPVILTPLYHTDGSNLVVAVESHVLKSLMRAAPEGMIDFPRQLYEIDLADNPILEIRELK